MIEFRLERMTCGHCAKAVASAIREVDPAAHMEVDLLNRKVKVDSTDAAPLLARALAERGYPPA
jgi:copper chaperone